MNVLITAALGLISIIGVLVFAVMWLGLLFGNDPEPTADTEEDDV